MYHSRSRLILASASPRRRDLLTSAGYEFDVIPANVDERRLDGETPNEFVSRVAMDKAEAVAVSLEHTRDVPIVLGADTVVLVSGEVLGKPRDRLAAASMLRRLSGRSHDVLTGVAIVHGSASRVVVETTRVTLARLEDATIDWYLSTGEADDKAGAYGAQGLASRFIEGIDGSYINVVGLPIARVDQLLGDLKRP